MIYEFKHFGHSEYFCKEYGKNLCFPSHLHQSFEFITITSGEMQLITAGVEYTLKKGESMLIFPNQLHSLESKSSEHMLCIFSPELVHAYASKVKDKQPENNKFILDEYLISAVDKLTEDSRTIEKKGVLYLICSAFDMSAVYKNSISSDESLLYKIFSFIESNYTNDCSLYALSKATGFSYSFLSHYFKKTMNLSFNTYVNKTRISKACYMLGNTSCSVLQCAYNCGYKSLRSFNRNFKALLGITPSEYIATLK